MRLLVTGRNGQIGWELVRSLAPLGTVIACSRDQADLSRPESLRGLIERARPDVIVNAAAYTAVDKAESEERIASTVNGDAVYELAKTSRDVGVLFVHFSTDYVFDGRKASTYVESDSTNPVNAYGRSKLAGELAVDAANGEWLIFRTSWVYGARGSNFLRTMLRLAQQRETLRIVSDQRGAPTSARMIADVIAHVIRLASTERAAGHFESGIFHLTSRGRTNWFEFASRIIETARERCPAQIATRDVEPIATSEYLTPAARPSNSLLDNTKLERRFGVSRQDWEESMQLVLEELLGTDR